ncbi:MAG: right-handed parallel beta-helix repeat-containing protein [Balneolaceae bacterium]
MKASIQTVFGILICLLINVSIFAQTNVSGTISSNTTWNVAGSPYIVLGSTTVNNGYTLTIESGVEVRFETGVQLTISGSLVGDGVAFTANSGSGREAWNRIYLNSASSNLSLSNSTIQFATNAIEVAYGTATLDTVIISDSKYGVFMHQNGNANITGSTITSTYYPIYYQSAGAITYFGENDFSGNDFDLVFSSFGSISNNWKLNYPGVPYYFTNSMYVNSGDTLTIAGSNILKFELSRELYTQNGGVINAIGTESEPIYFTSWRNDNIGGDTNNDGNATSPTNKDWYGIRLIGKNATSSFKNVNVSFAGYQYSNDYRGGITHIDNDSEIDSSTFNNNLYGIVLRDSSDAKITHNTIGSSGVVPVALTFDSQPVFTDNAFSSSNNQYDAIGLIGTTISGVNTLPKRNFTAIPNVTYVLLSNLTVASGASLDIEKGVVIKGLNYTHINVFGTLTSIGTASEKIVFTAIQDDNVGNPKDTNKDGNNTVPGTNSWYGIALGENAGNSVLDYNIIRYATYSNSISGVQLRGALNILSSNVAVSNSEIGNTQYYAIDSRGIAKPTISNNSFSNTGSVPVALDLSSDPTFSGNTLANVGLKAIGYHGGSLSTDGIIRNRDFAGYIDITTVLLETATVESGAKLTIEPGTVIKVHYEYYSGILLNIKGALDATGKADSVIYFTSIYDDQIGNPLDTNGDGGTTTPAPGNWGTIRFFPTTDDANSNISNTELRYNRHGLIFSNAAPTIDNVTILSCQYTGFGMEGGSTVHIANSTIQNCGYDPVAISTNSNPTFSNITFNSNGSNGIGLLEAQNLSTYYANTFNSSGLFYSSTNTISTDATVVPKSFAGYANLPYIVRNQFTVGTNTTLQISPSVIFKGNTYTYIDGAIKVNGTEKEPVIFTSYSDDSAGGDTNNDGNNSVPNRGQSLHLMFRASSIDSANHIKNAEFRYSGTAITFHNSKAVVDNSLFQLTNGHAIEIFGSSAPIIQNNRFENIGESSYYYRRHSIYMDMFVNPTFSGNTESNVSIRGLGIRSGAWGSDAILPFRSFAGDDSVSYVMYGKFTIPSGSKITIPAGMVLKAFTQYGTSRAGNSGFSVEGALVVQGDSLNPVIFTSDTDDRFGNPSDLYGDGQVDDEGYRGSTPWITYSATSDDTNNVVQNAIFKYKNVAILANSANPTIKNSTFERNNYGIQLTGVSAPFVEKNSFHDLDKTPLLTSLVSYPQTTAGNTMSGTTWQGIGVQSETLVQDVTLPKRNFGGKLGIPYVFTGSYTIGTGAVLTIEPGVINKFANQSWIDVQKGLIANGGSTSDSLIIFTSIADDFYGGDTNSNGSEDINSYPYWRGIRYLGTSLPSVSILNNTVLKRVGYYGPYSNGDAAVLADNSSPTITNSTITSSSKGVEIYGSGNPIINFNDIYNNKEYGVYNRDKTFTVDATNNWWGNDSGPTHASNPSGTGDVVTDAVNYAPFQGSGATKPVLGDVSLNGVVQSFDASKLLRHVAFLDTLNSTQLAVADVSGNGTVSAMDASYILQYVVGLIDAFPAELNSKIRAEMNEKKANEHIILSLGESVELGNNEFSVPLTFTNLTELFAFEIDLDFDGAGLEVIDVKTSEALDGTSLTFNKSKVGKLTLAMASANAIAEDGEFVNVVFKLKDAHTASALHIKRFIANEMDMSKSAVNSEVAGVNLPDKFELYQNYPNPFNPTTTIGFDVPNANSHVRLEIFNILGQRVKMLVNNVYSAGRYKVIWDGTNDAGMQVSTGVYIYRINAGDIVQSKKLTFIK